jgi:D-glycero-alpha-D-manno-heptose 1-phosphate guanylyltransferase
MALIGGVPFLEILIDCLAAKGVRDFVLLTGYKSDMIEEYFSNRYGGELSVRVSEEEVPLGTGGAVKNAERFATDPSLLVNGDTYFDADLESLFQFHREKESHVSLSLLHVDDASRYGSVSVDDGGRIVGFYEKNEGPGGAGLINGGLSLVSRKFIEDLPKDRAFSMEQEIFPSFVKSGRMFGLRQNRDFFDIGTPESYEAFKVFVAKRNNPSQ